MQDDLILKTLAKQLAKYIKEITNRKVVFAGPSVIPKQTVPYAVIDENSLRIPRWATNELLNDAGEVVQSYSSTVNIVVTVCEDDYLDPENTEHYFDEDYRTAFNDARKILSGFDLDYLVYHYFNSKYFAFAHGSDIQRLRVPRDTQTFETRCRVVLTFNICFVDTDYGQFEDLQGVGIKINTTATDEVVQSNITVDTSNP